MSPLLASHAGPAIYAKNGSGWEAPACFPVLFGAGIHHVL